MYSWVECHQSVDGLSLMFIVISIFRLVLAAGETNWI